MDVERLIAGLLVVLAFTLALALAVFEVDCLRAARRCLNSSSLDLAEAEDTESAATAEDGGGVLLVAGRAVVDLVGDVVVVVVVLVVLPVVPNSRRNRSSSRRVKLRFETDDARTNVPHFSGHSKYVLPWTVPL